MNKSFAQQMRAGSRMTGNSSIKPESKEDRNQSRNQHQQWFDLWMILLPEKKSDVLKSGPKFRTNLFQFLQDVLELGWKRDGNSDFRFFETLRKRAGPLPLALRKSRKWFKMKKEIKGRRNGTTESANGLGARRNGTKSFPLLSPRIFLHAKVTRPFNYGKLS